MKALSAGLQAAIAARQAQQLVVCSQCWGLACEVGRSSPPPTAVSFWCYSHRRVLEGPATRQSRAARHARAAQLAGGGKVAANDGGTLHEEGKRRAAGRGRPHMQGNSTGGWTMGRKACCPTKCWCRGTRQPRPMMTVVVIASSSRKSTALVGWSAMVGVRKGKRQRTRGQG